MEGGVAPAPARPRAADQLLVPVSCEYLPIVGPKLFGDTLEKLKTPRT